MPMSKDVHDSIISEMPKYIKVHVIVSKSILDATQTNMFVKLSWNGFAVRLFSNELEAKEWLKMFLWCHSFL